MPLLSEAPNEVRLIVDEVIEKYHQPLRDAGITVDLWFARAKNSEDFFGCLRLHGYTCAAIAKIIPYKLRVQGHGDAEITIDARKWDTMEEDEKRALIDHELTHFEIKTDKKGAIKRDDLDRVVLKARKHDHQFGWFDAVARRHGAASFEVKQAEDFVVSTLKQKWLPFLKEAFADMKPAQSIPSRVRIAREVFGLGAGGVGLTLKLGEEYDAQVNPQGAVAAKVDGDLIGLKPGEFDVILWADSEKAAPAKKKEAATSAA